MKPLDQYETPESDEFEYYFSNHDSFAGESIYTVIGDKDVTWNDLFTGHSVPSSKSRDLERRLAACREQLRSIMESSSSSRIRRECKETLALTAP